MDEFIVDTSLILAYSKNQSQIWRRWCETHIFARDKRLYILPQAVQELCSQNPPRGFERLHLHSAVQGESHKQYLKGVMAQLMADLVAALQLPQRSTILCPPHRENFFSTQNQ